MSEISDQNIPHEGAAARATDAQMRRTSSAGPIDYLEAPSATYVENEALATQATINAIINVLRDAELIPNE